MGFKPAIESYHPVKCPTKRAPDAGDSGEISGIFLRLIIFPLGRRSAPAPAQVTQTVSWQSRRE